MRDLGADLVSQSYSLETYTLHAASSLACTATIRSFAGEAFLLSIHQDIAGMTTRVSFVA